MKSRAKVLLTAACLAGGVGCLPGSPAAMAGPEGGFGTGRLGIVAPTDTLWLRVEIAEDPRQQSIGLMRRSALPEDSGMLFLFAEEQPPETGFWMYRTPVPLSIAYLDAGGSIVAIRQMEPCTSRFSFRCPRYPAGVPFRAALEVNQGYFLRHGIPPGARTLLRRDSSGAGPPRP